MTWFCYEWLKRMAQEQYPDPRNKASKDFAASVIAAHPDEYFPFIW